MKKFVLLALLVFSSVLICFSQAFSPSALAPALWLDAADSSTVVHTSGAVSTWNDKSGNGHHVTESNPAYQPEYISVSEGIYFDGADLLMGDNTLVYGADTTISIFVAVNIVHGADKGSVIAKGQWTSGADYRIELGENGFDATLQGARRWNSSGGDWNISHKNIFSSAFASDKSVIYHLNTSHILTNSPVYNVSYNPNSSPFSIGARFTYSDHFNGEILEVLVFDKELSFCERRKMEGYLINKWGVQAYITTNHPFKANDFGLCDGIETSVAENSPNGTVIDTLDGTYFGLSTTFSDWRIEDGGMYDGLFALDSDGKLTVDDNSFLDYEKISSYYLEVSALANGATRVHGAVNIDIIDENDGGLPKTNSELWGQSGEKWDPRGRLPDFSYVGYKSREEDYHYVNSIVDVTSFGANETDSLSDVTAIQNAIASIDSGIVYFPPGLYVIDDYITIYKDNIVLRGAGNDSITGTRFYLPKTSDELSGSYDYIIKFWGDLAGPKHFLSEAVKMGDRSVTLENVSGLEVGEYVDLGYSGTHPADGELWDHILNNQNPDWPCSVAWSNGNGGLMMYHTIERIEGNIVTLKEPIRLDMNLSWTPHLTRRTDWFIKNCGIENIFIRHKYIPQPPHLEEPGYNSIKFRCAFNCWIDNVSIVDADNGIRFDLAGFSEIKNITFIGRGGHHGYTFAYSSHCLADSVHFANYDPWIHSFTLTHKANGNVISNHTGVDGIPISSDFHRNTPWETLMTNIDNTWNYNSSGVWCAGPNAGKRTVYWNMGGDGFTTFPNWDDYQTTLVGEMHIPEKFHSEKGWHENVPALSPENLYTAQFNRRLNLPADPLFQPDTLLGNRLNWWERDPARWRVKNPDGNHEYQMFFSETPSLTGNRLGEYALLDSTFTGDILLSADARTLEKLNLNNAADLALIVNYQDDENYYFAKISSSLAESGIYKSENGTATLLAPLNIGISDNYFHRYSFSRTGDSLLVYYDYQRIAGVFETGFSGGRIGIGTYDDAAAFNNIGLNDIQHAMVWTGLTSSDWSTATNWKPETVPLDVNDVLIPSSPAGGIYPVTNSLQNAVCNDLMIQNGAHLTVPSNGEITVKGRLSNHSGTNGILLQADATGTASLLHDTYHVEGEMESYISEDQWHIISAPITGAQSNVFLDLYLMYFDETDYSWHYITPLDYDLREGRGFMAWSESSSTGNATVSYEGNLNNGDILVTGLSYTASQPMAERGWNLVGNPYPSAIHWNSGWTRTNLDATIYVYDAGTSGNYLTYNTSGIGTHPTGNIAPGQGFWVEANDAGASLTIPQSERKHSNQGFYKDGEQLNLLSLRVEGNGYADKMIVQFNDDATAGFDTEFDAWKFEGDEAAPQLYSVYGNNELAVNILPFVGENMIIPVNFKAGAETLYTISVADLANFDEGVEVFLEDLNENNMIDLPQVADYSFNASPMDAPERFLLHFSKTAFGTEEHATNDFQIYTYDKDVYVKVPVSTTGDIKVYNIMGQEITSVSINNILNKVTLEKSAYYVVVVSSQETFVTEKVFIR